MKKSALGIFGLVVLTGAISYGSTASEADAFIGQYSLVAGDSVCSSELKITIDGNNFITLKDQYQSRIWNISTSECTNVLKTTSDAKHSDCMNVSSDEIVSSRITPMPLGQNIQATGIKFSSESRNTLIFYRKSTNYGSALILSKMLQEDPGFKCMYNRN